MSSGSQNLSRCGRPGRRTVTFIVSLCLAMVWLKGCGFVGDKFNGNRDDELKFSHADHHVYLKDCDECHLDPSTKDMIWSGHGQCVACHESADEAKPADNECLLCHYTLTPTKTKRAERPDYGVAIFDHKGHEAVKCSDCHGRIDRKGPFRKAEYPWMEDCLDCHFPGLSEKSSARCSLCHGGLRADFKPENHAQPQWGVVHGQRALNNPNLCFRCHVQTRDCDACHRVERPRSHTATFRTKTHGFHAMSNPMSCETCHRQDFCQACHSITEPLTHTGSFKRRPYFHCATCHLPLDDGNRCSVCHQGDPHDRVVATPPPPQLVAAGRIDPSGPCLPCHPVARVPITHPYNTISPFQCVPCHRPL